MSFIINILSTPAILVGLISLFGVVKGTVKTIVGFLVLTAGSSFLQTGSLNDFGVIFNYAFNMQGVVPNNEAIVSLGLADFASDTAYIMCIGMIANIVLARFSRLHYIFLTGHHTLYMSAMLAIILNVGNLTGPMLWISGGLILGLIMVISPALCQPTMEKITGTDELGFGHFGGFGYWFSAQIGKPEEDLEKLKVFVGPPLMEQFMKYAGVDEATGRKAVEFYRERYEVKGIYENHPYEGVEEMLQELKRKGYILAVASSKPEYYVTQILDYFKLSSYFDVVVGSEMNGARTSKSEVIEEALKRINMSDKRNEVLMVGDKEHDVLGARAAGLDCVAVAYGYGTQEELTEANPLKIVDSVDELLHFFD